MTQWQIVGGVLGGVGFCYVMQRLRLRYMRAWRALALQSENSMFRTLALSSLVASPRKVLGVIVGTRICFTRFKRLLLALQVERG